MLYNIALSLYFVCQTLEIQDYDTLSFKLIKKKIIKITILI